MSVIGVLCSGMTLADRAALFRSYEQSVSFFFIGSCSMGISPGLVSVTVIFTSKFFQMDSQDATNPSYYSLGVAFSWFMSLFVPILCSHVIYNLPNSTDYNSLPSFIVTISSCDYHVTYLKCAWRTGNLLHKQHFMNCSAGDTPVTLCRVHMNENNSWFTSISSEPPFSLSFSSTTFIVWTDLFSWTFDDGW